MEATWFAGVRLTVGKLARPRLKVAPLLCARVKRELVRGRTLGSRCRY